MIEVVTEWAIISEGLRVEIEELLEPPFEDGNV
jgi:hypothetical protein